MVRSGCADDLIWSLFDARVLHVLKKNISAADRAGERYDVFGLDFGCYVDLMTTARAPQGLLPTDGEGTQQFVDVPPDDYRSIRRAILDLKAFRGDDQRNG